MSAGFIARQEGHTHHGSLLFALLTTCLKGIKTQRGDTPDTSSSEDTPYLVFEKGKILLGKLALFFCLDLVFFFSIHP